MDHYTVLVIPEGTDAPRRFRVPRERVRRGAFALAAAAVIALAIGIDYVRVRLQVVELDSLRVETASQQKELEELGASIGTFEKRLSALDEFERKVRVMADLPPVVAGPGDGMIAVGGSDRAVLEPRAGEGGSTEVPLEIEPEEAIAEPEEHAAAAAAPAVSDADATLRQRARRINRRAESRETTLSDLVAQLEGKRRQLESTPSIWPARGWLTSRFGHRISPFTGLRQMHSGIDIAAEPGTPIVAPARGRVIFAGHKGHLGNTIVVDHGFKMRTTFGHTKEMHVKTGEEIRRGQIIASVGSTGRSTGPHLHYGISVKGRAVNPLNYILQ